MNSSTKLAASAFNLNLPKLMAEFGEQLLQRLPHQVIGLAAPELVQTFARQFAAEYERNQERGVRASAQDYNVWIARLFEEVESGSSYKELIKAYLDEIESLIKEKKSDALFAAVIEQVTDGSKPIGYALGPRCGDIHPLHWQNFASQISSLNRSSFLDQLFAQDGGLPLLLAGWIDDYDGIFNSFVRSSMGRWAHEIKPNSFWLTAVSLLADKEDEPRRILFLAYRNIGTGLIPNPGKGAALETRVLDTLRIAYGQIDRQSQALSRYLVDERADIIKSLYPAILAHDFKAPLGNIHSQTILALEANQDIAKLLLTNADQDGLIEANKRSLLKLAGLLQQVTKLHEYLGAYASLEKISDEPWLLHDGLRTVEQLLYARVLHEKVYVSMPKKPSERMRRSYQVVIDQGLFLVVLVNILQNAINMMVHENSKHPEKMQKRRIELRIERDPVQNQLLLWVGNTDTHIQAEHRERIFKKGFSTRGGSGTGLYLCRRIAAYWGGSLVLCDEDERVELDWSDSYQVVFRLHIPLPTVQMRKNK